MGTLDFLCPTTGLEVVTGLEMDHDNLRRTAKHTGRFSDDGRLEQPSELQIKAVAGPGNHLTFSISPCPTSAACCSSARCTSAP
jgi:hypothetical protein